jgi:hypothetical protein
MGHPKEETSKHPKSRSTLFEIPRSESEMSHMVIMVIPVEILLHMDEDIAIRESCMWFQVHPSFKSALEILVIGRLFSLSKRVGFLIWGLRIQVGVTPNFILLWVEFSWVQGEEVECRLVLDDISPALADVAGGFYTFVEFEFIVFPAPPGSFMIVLADEAGSVGIHWVVVEWGRVGGLNGVKWTGEEEAEDVGESFGEQEEGVVLILLEFMRTLGIELDGELDGTYLHGGTGRAWIATQAVSLLLKGPFKDKAPSRRTRWDLQTKRYNNLPDDRHKMLCSAGPRCFLQ